MPEAFYKHVKRLKTHAYMQMLTIIVAIVTCGLAIGMLSTSKITSACFAIISAFLFVVFFLLDRIENRSYPDFYTAIVSVDNIESTLLKYQAEKIADDSYVWFCSISRFHARILILLEDEFQVNAVKNRKRRMNHVINQKYGISATISISDSYGKLRMNLLIVNHDCSELHNWLSENTAVSLRRAEPIIHAAIALDRRELLFPSLKENVSLNALDKYLFAAEILTRVFCS